MHASERTKMGEAKRRGTPTERKANAIQRTKRRLASVLEGVNDQTKKALRSGIDALLARMKVGEWEHRKRRLIERLNRIEGPRPLEEALPIRVKDDEIAWYIFLAEQVFEDPLCLEVSQAARCLPFIAGLGAKWQFSSSVTGIFDKIDELLSDYRASPDGLLFELLVALSYAEKGWQVELLKRDPTRKTPDLRIQRGGHVYYAECKRQSRTSEYAEKERTEFLRRWGVAKDVLLKYPQWLWFKCEIHVEVDELPLDFFRKLLTQALPAGDGITQIYNGPEATLACRHIDRAAVRGHLQNYMVKQYSPALGALLGQEWAPPGAQVTVAMCVTQDEVADCKAPVIGSYIREVQWASGITRVFDGEKSIEKKARNVKNLLVDAIEQVPEETPSIIHIAYEALDGEEVERRRVEKVMESIPYFKTTKPVAGICLHRLTTNAKIDKLWELDETVAWFEPRGTCPIENVPLAVVVPSNADLINAENWSLGQPHAGRWYVKTMPNGQV